MDKINKYLNEGKSNFWKGQTDYLIRQIGKDVYEVSGWKRGDTPSVLYKCSGSGKKMKCNCPARGPCRHIKMVQDWIKMGKPDHPFFGDVKKEVAKGLKKLGVKIYRR
jgi:hypothetical protein